MKRLAVSLVITVCVFFAPGLLSADDHPDRPSGSPKDTAERRLERLAWNPVTCELSWTVSEGTRDASGQYIPSGKMNSYKINMDDATMVYKTSTRRFAKEEAVQVHAILNALKAYAEQSTDWWNAGKGERLDKLARAFTPPIAVASQ